MEANPVRWFEIYVQDMNRAKKFYESVLQLKLDKLETPEALNQPKAPKFEIWAFPMLKDKVGCGGALVCMEGFPSGGNSTLIYFACEDCSVEAGRVLKAGGRIEKEKFSIGQYGHIALAYDTEGNMFGLHSME
jgi:predicted enzyme related to lactoylglutathione lyase